MNKNNKKILLLKSIINSDFLFLDQNANKKLRHVTSVVGLNEFVATSLNPFETLKGVKQLVRSLQFLAKQDNNVLHICVENKQYLSLLNSILGAKKLNLSVFVKDFLIREKMLPKSNQSLLLLTSAIKNDQKLLKKFFYKNIFLINKINAKIESNNLGTYKIYNDLNSFKKLIFLLVIVDLVFTAKNS
jgi:hypothetical protein